MVEVTDFLPSLKNTSDTKKKKIDEQTSDSGDDIDKTTILFLAADPSDASRLRLGQELREIQEKLQMAQMRDIFKIVQKMSVRVVDISQAILDEKPIIVHFSGHGTSAGELCFENEVGQLQTVQPEALAALFNLFSDQIDCVLMNACYSVTQAEAIAKHIKYVIGMNKAIGDKAAISFAVGFYQALGAGKSIEKAYDFGCVQIMLQGIPEYLTPVLIKKHKTRKNAVLFDNTHGQEKWVTFNPPPTIGGGYKRIEGITRQHYTVEVLEAGEAISLEKLREHVAFILTIGPDKSCFLKKEELDAIREYVRQGGGVLILSTYTGDWHHEANLNQLAEGYGMTFNNDVVMPKDATPDDARIQLSKGKPSSEYAVLAQPVEDGGIKDTIRTELLKDVRQIVTLSSCSLNITNAATAVLCSESESTVFEPEPTGRGVQILSYQERGKDSVALVGASKVGKVVTVGSWKTFLDDFVNEPNYDNARLYENILYWLTARR